MSVSALVTEDSKVNLWLTQFDPEFNRNMFLYHYTSFENACKILYDESLRFSSLSRSNDTLESKPKIKAKNINNEQDLKRIFEHFDKINKSQIQLLCFSKDLSIEINQINPSKIYDDYTGRGFALPRMWAQYGHNNSGVSIIQQLKYHKSFGQITKNDPNYNRTINWFDEEGSKLILRINRKPKEKKKRNEVATYFGIPKFHLGTIKIVDLKEYYNPKLSYYLECGYVSAFKVIVNKDNIGK